MIILFSNHVLDFRKSKVLYQNKVVAEKSNACMFACMHDCMRMHACPTKL